MNTSSTLETRKSATRGLALVAAAGIVLVLATTATAITLHSNNVQQTSEISLLPAE